MTDRAITLHGSPILTDPLAVADSPRAWGIVPTFAQWYGHLFSEWGNQFGAGRLSSTWYNQARLGHLGTYPRCRVIDVPYDDAGIDFPDGALQVLAGSCMTAGRHSAVVSSARVALPSARHWIALTVCVGGIPAATTGTITITRTADWWPGATDAATLYTINVDGANGLQQEFLVADLISAPQNIRPNSTASNAIPTAGLFIYINVSWTGTAPQTIHAWWNPSHLTSGPVVPDSVPGDFETRTASDWQHTYDTGPQRANWRGPWSTYLGEGSPHNQRFSREWSADFDLMQAIIPTNRPARRSFGLPDWIVQNQNQIFWRSTEWPLVRPRPCAWIDGDLHQLGYWPSSMGVLVWGVFVPSTGAGGFGSRDSTVSSVTAPAIGNGWRNCRIWLVTRDEVDSPSVLDVSVKVLVDGVEIDTVDFTSSAVNDYFDIPDCYPATRKMDAELTFEVHVQVVDPGPGYTGSINVTFWAFLSPRIDIPIPTHTVGPEGIEAPGGYLDDLSAPEAMGAVQHVAVGTSSVSWTVTVGTNNTQARLISFVPPTSGLWKVAAPSGTRTTFGEKEFRQYPQPAVLGRANKRFYGYLLGSDTACNGTWELTAVTRTPKTIAEAGTSIVAGDLSPTTDGYLFGTITISTPGRYRVWMRCTPSNLVANGATWVMRLSLTDPYVLDSVDAVGRVANTPWASPATTASSPPGSPTHGAAYWITATATGVWAGREGQLARWDRNQGWQYLIPRDDERTWVSLDSVTQFWNGTAWETNSTARHIVLEIDVPEAGTLYVRANRDDEDEFHDSNSISPVANGSCVIGWEAV